MVIGFWRRVDAKVCRTVHRIDDLAKPLKSIGEWFDGFLEERAVQLTGEMKAAEQMGLPRSPTDREEFRRVMATLS